MYNLIYKNISVRERKIEKERERHEEERETYIFCY